MNEQKIKTNADRIREMTDECTKAWLAWLRSPVEEIHE